MDEDGLRSCNNCYNADQCPLKGDPDGLCHGSMFLPKSLRNVSGVDFDGILRSVEGFKKICDYKEVGIFFVTNIRTENWYGKWYTIGAAVYTGNPYLVRKAAQKVPNTYEIDRIFLLPLFTRYKDYGAFIKIDLDNPKTMQKAVLTLKHRIDHIPEIKRQEEEAREIERLASEERTKEKNRRFKELAKLGCEICKEE